MEKDECGETSSFRKEKEGELRREIIEYGNISDKFIKIIKELTSILSPILREEEISEGESKDKVSYKTMVGTRMLELNSEFSRSEEHTSELQSH